MSKRGTAVLDTPQPEYAPESSYARRSTQKSDPRFRRDSVEDFAGSYDDHENEPARGSRARSGQRESGSRSTLKLKFASRIPTSLIGRIASGIVLLIIAGGVFSLLMVTRTFLLHDARFMIQSPAAIEIQGNKHLTRAQLLGIFGEDVERNIFRISLDDRQALLEALPWVQHATVMRLLPGRIRIAIVERIPVAFVRQGSHIGLVDAHGVLLDLSAGSQAEAHYSFPVVTGILSTDPASTRMARMKIFERFTRELDSAGEKISDNLSEVDLSNPEDVKVLIPDHSTEVLVHFGDDHFLERYRKFQQLLPQWNTQYPTLASVDMRYEREVVLDMAKSAAAKTDTPAPVHSVPPTQPAAKLHAVAKPTSTTPHSIANAPPVPVRVPVRPPARPATSAAVHTPAIPNSTAKPTHPTAEPSSVQKSLQPNSIAATHPLPVAQTPVSTLPSASASARSSYPAAHATKAPEAKFSTGKPSAGKPLVLTPSYHSPQVATP